jgi:hypothetical protein
MSAVLFLNLSQKWEKIIKFWSKNEKPFLVKPYTALKNKGTLKKRILNISIIIFAMSACEQIQFLNLCIIFICLFISKYIYPYLCSSVSQTFSAADKCSIIILHPYSFFLLNQYRFVFQFMPFYLISGLLVEVFLD